MGKEYFCAYHSYLSSVEPLDDAERGRLFTACLVYSATGEVPALCGNERFVFPTMKAQIDRDTEKYSLLCKKQSDNVKKRWSARDTKDTTVYGGISGIPSDTKRTNEKEKEKEKEKENNKAPSKAPKRRYAEFVSLTDEEHAKLVSAHGEQMTARMIEVLDNYKGASGKKYSSDYRAILNWVVSRVREEDARNPKAANYDDDEGVFTWTT